MTETCNTVKCLTAKKAALSRKEKELERKIALIKERKEKALRKEKNEALKQLKNSAIAQSVIEYDKKMKNSIANKKVSLNLNAIIKYNMWNNTYYFNVDGKNNHINMYKKTLKNEVYSLSKVNVGRFNKFVDMLHKTYKKYFTREDILYTLKVNDWKKLNNCKYRLMAFFVSCGDQ